MGGANVSRRSEGKLSKSINKPALTVQQKSGQLCFIDLMVNECWLQNFDPENKV